jgi:NAD(P)-dependent dehydrogenase (short-subunit alcohol dehydrogenase family)
MAQRLKDSMVMITGAGRGLGRALALQFAQRGARLALCDLPGANWKDIHEDCKANGAMEVFSADADVRDEHALRRLVADAEALLGPTDILVANAGVGINTPVVCAASAGTGECVPGMADRSDLNNALAQSLSSFKHQVDVNLVGVMNSIAAVLPGMLRRRQGQIAAIASLAGYRGLPALSGYCSSKAGVITLMESLRLDLAPQGIRCTMVCPGWIETGVYDTLKSAKPGVMNVDSAARRIVHGIASGKKLIAFPWWLHWLFAINRSQWPWLSDWMLRLVWKAFGGK